MLAAAGASVGVVSRTLEDARAFAALLGTDHLGLEADLTDPTRVSRVIDAVQHWCGAPDILVNNAGSFPNAPLEALDPAEIAKTLQLNLEAPFQLVRAFLPAMRARRAGDIVTVGSIADRAAFTGNAAYSASKYGVRGLHEVLRAETRGTGVRAILVSPGPVNTGIWDQHAAHLGGRFPKREAMLGAEDVARSIVFAVSQPPHVDIDELRLTQS
jgi:NADP-dependent 3-hydroxy acid dehydrogenase YdfG